VMRVVNKGSNGHATKHLRDKHSFNSFEVKEWDKSWRSMIPRRPILPEDYYEEDSDDEEIDEGDDAQNAAQGNAIVSHSHGNSSSENGSGNTSDSSSASGCEERRTIEKVLVISDLPQKQSSNRAFT
jgi:hypothetical protein